MKTLLTKLIDMFKHDWKELGAESSEGGKNFKSKYPLIFYPTVLSISFLFMFPIVLFLDYVGFDPNKKLISSNNYFCAGFLSTAI